MQNDLLIEVQEGLKARKGEWKRIANAIPGVSYSWLSQIGRGKYTSDPTHGRLKAVAEHLRGLNGAA